MFEIPKGPGWGKAFKITGMPRTEVTEPRDSIIADSNLVGVGDVCGKLKTTFSRIISQLPGEISDELGTKFQNCRDIVGSLVIATAIFMFHYKDGLSDFEGEEYSRLRQHVSAAVDGLNKFSEAAGLGSAFEGKISLDEKGNVVTEA